MKKHLTSLLLLAGLAFGAEAQTTQSATGTQTMSMTTGNSVAITFTSNSSATGSTISLPFTTADDYANGKTSADQEIQIISNKAFNVVVKASATNFTYTGSVSPAPAMPVNGILKLMVPANATGGSIAAPFSASGFSTLTSTDQNLITNGDLGSNQLFSVRYMATPGFAYPSGTYTVDIVYTATQL